VSGSPLPVTSAATNLFQPQLHESMGWFSPS
jgi:hypothetical protein